MSGIANLSDKMKKKLSLDDYFISAETVVATTRAETPIPEVRCARKLYALSKEDANRLQEIFSKRLTSKPSAICQIMSEAIDRLYQQEMF